MMAPAVIVLLIWMIVPLVMTLWFSFQNYSLINPMMTGFAGWGNYLYVIGDPSFTQALINTLLLVAGVLLITVSASAFPRTAARPADLGPGDPAHPRDLALLRHAAGRGADLEERLHASRLWHVRARCIKMRLGLQPVDWFSTSFPLFSIIVMVAWQWLPFATLILLTALQSLSRGAARGSRDGWRQCDQRRFWYIILPHMARAITIVILIQTIFLLGIFAEIRVTTGGGPGYASTNIAFLVFRTGILSNDIGAGSAGGVVAVIIANIVAFFLMRAVGRNLRCLSSTVTFQQAITRDGPLFILPH
jgi:sorbitol/mannitol transport system permease protein